ncbi:geranylgeranyl transferase type I beta subunit [Moelleriella libera RCEF 2490]|uniref:Geranylgeranyl transferase type I beta subunit n=1 Tax=Moelleriella libera RCEF 2490 TaxID=1081109 RepID=A0A167WK85_9HYPO|nr:geranylgeranyl transferase type I beta subunit [Moelleriella libera RCEF 2490]
MIERAQMMDSSYAVNMEPSRTYLTNVTQHRIGGFSKYGGGHPDIFHSYLGLLALAILGDAELKDVDAGLCCSKETVRKLGLARNGSSREKGHGTFESDGFWDTIQRSDGT